jgi:hypothetical protein
MEAIGNRQGVAKLFEVIETDGQHRAVSVWWRRGTKLVPVYPPLSLALSREGRGNALIRIGEQRTARFFELL